MARIIVVGAGVIGLTCAVRLLEAGHRVDVVARDLALETTSCVAAALVLPYRASPAVAEDLRWRGWIRATEDRLARLTDRPEDTGVRVLPGTETPRAGYAVQRRVPVVDMPVHLPWLVRQVEALGGTVTRLNLSALPTHGDLVVNCSGLGARLLGSDHSVLPVAGQVVVVEQVGLERWWVDDSSPDRLTYAVPRLREIVLGGTAQPGEWSRTPLPQVAERIVRRAAEIDPRLGEARVLRHRVGLRPTRPEVRLERVGDVVHNYGHGGSGVTLAWGCADDVVALVG